MHKFRLIFSSVFILISSTMAVAGETENEKYQFIKDIYSESWALIIGINKYQHVDQLNYAVDDAVAVKEMLVEKYGFKEDHIKLITDEEATKDNILKGFSDILTQAKEKDRVVVFYAGHGETYKLPSGGDMGYLIPVDGNLDNLYLSSIPMKSVYDIADMSYAKHILYLVDACYGGLTLATTRGLKKDITPAYLKKMTSERGRQVITAGGKGEQVIEKAEWGHSAFTKSLLKGLGDGLADENDDGIITADELGVFIKNRVVVDVDGAHTPQKGRIGSDMGEFVFISKTLEEQVASTDSADDGLDEIKDQMAAQQKQMAQLTELLLAQAQQAQQTQAVAPVENYPKVTPESKKPKKPKQPANMKTASTLSWVFPGMGHYYSGRSGKGVMFTGLELAALSGVAVFSANFADESDNYDVAVANYNYYLNSIDFSSGDPENALLQKEVTDAFNKKQGVRISLISAGSISVGVWLWNIIDIKKSKSKSYSSSSPVSIGINSRGQVEARFSF